MSAAANAAKTEILTSQAPGQACGRNNDQRHHLYLILFTSGIRRANNPNGDDNFNESVRVLIGGVETTPLFAGKATGFVGLEQINSFELPREWIGRGRMSLAVSVEGFGTSNPGEIEIARPPNAAAPVIAGLNPDSMNAGETLRITGSGFASNPAENLVRIGSVEATVTAASPAQLSVVVPFGAESSQVSVRTPQGEAASATRLTVRASLSGFVEDTRRQPLSGVAVKVAGTNISATTNAEGAFILPNVQAGAVQIEADGPSARFGRGLCDRQLQQQPLHLAIGAGRQRLRRVHADDHRHRQPERQRRPGRKTAGEHCTDS